MLDLVFVVSDASKMRLPQTDCLVAVQTVESTSQNRKLKFRSTEAPFRRMFSFNP